MKFQIASELQRRWLASPPSGWTAAKELDLLTSRERTMLGYRPVVDLVLTHGETRKRLWIELEISRADPVANHTKFASAHLLNPIPRQDAFVSLVSNHVTRGRANLAAHTIYLLRAGGIRAFQMPLLADLAGDLICRINQGKLALDHLPTPDLREVIDLTQPLVDDPASQIYYATNPLEVILNVRQWNIDASDRRSAEAWGHRRVTYLVFDKRTQLFAPSKFCAYTRMQHPDPCPDDIPFNPAMTIGAYAAIPQDHPIFDGQKAWKRLSRIGFQKVPASAAAPSVRGALASWLKQHASLITAAPRKCEILITP